MEPKIFRIVAWCDMTGAWEPADRCLYLDASTALDAMGVYERDDAGTYKIQWFLLTPMMLSVWPGVDSWNDMSLTAVSIITKASSSESDSDSEEEYSRVRHSLADGKVAHASVEAKPCTTG